MQRQWYHRQNTHSYMDGYLCMQLGEKRQRAVHAFRRKQKRTPVPATRAIPHGNLCRPRTLVRGAISCAMEDASALFRPTDRFVIYVHSTLPVYTYSTLFDRCYT
jgi:hypothetical protein